MTWLFSFFSVYIYSYIYLKRANGDPITNTPKNVFLYTWNNLINLNDYGPLVTALVTGLAFTIGFTICNIIYYKLKGQLNRENFKRELFEYNAKEHYKSLRIKIWYLDKEVKSRCTFGVKCNIFGVKNCLQIM